MLPYESSYHTQEKKISIKYLLQFFENLSISSLHNSSKSLSLPKGPVPPVEEKFPSPSNKKYTKITRGKNYGWKQRFAFWCGR